MKKWDVKNQNIRFVFYIPLYNSSILQEYLSNLQEYLSNLQEYLSNAVNIQSISQNFSHIGTFSLEGNSVSFIHGLNGFFLLICFYETLNT